MPRTFKAIDWADFLALLQDGKLSIRQMGKYLGKSKSTLQEVLSKRLVPEFVNMPVRGSARGYKSSRSVYTLTARGNEVVKRYADPEKINRTPTMVTRADNPDTPRENLGEEYLSLHHITVKIPFLTIRPSKLPMLVIRTEDTYSPRKLDRGKIDNWNYIRDHQPPVRLKKKKDPSRFPGITINQGMSNWDWYTFQEEVEGKGITAKIWRREIEISIPELKASKDTSAYDMIDIQLERYLPYILDLEEKLGRSFSRNLTDWQPKFRRLDKGMPAMTLTAEIAHVGDEFARIVWKNGEPGQRVMRWFGEDGKERMHIDWSHNPDEPEIEFTGTGTFADDSEALRTFKEEIGPEEYRDLARDMEHHEFGDMILDRADGKWRHKVEQRRLRLTEKEVTEIKSVLVRTHEFLELSEKKHDRQMSDMRGIHEEEISDMRALMKEFIVTMSSALGLGGH